MEIQVFVREIKSLENFFKRDLASEQIKDWYEELKKIDVVKLRLAIKEAKKTCKYMPSLSELCDLVKLIHTTDDELKNQKVECEKCKGLGLVFYTKLIERYGYQYAARCTCQNGKLFNYIPTIEELLSQKY